MDLSDSLPSHADGPCLGGTSLPVGVIYVDASACSSPVDLSAYATNDASWQLAATISLADQYALALQVGPGATTNITDDAGPAGTLFDNNVLRHPMLGIQLHHAARNVRGWRSWP